MAILPPQIEQEETIVRRVEGEAPLSFVPHTPDGVQPVRIRTGRYGEMDEHELIHLLDSIEDERARGRFRESVYMSVFICLLLAWVVLYGPRYLWHAPQLISPTDVLRQREVVRLDNPVLSPKMSAPAAKAPRNIENKLDAKTLESMRAASRAVKTPTPAPAPPPVTRPLPNAPAPNLPEVATAQPTVKTPPPVVADAPRPQTPTANRPNFGTQGSAGDAVQQAIRDSARSGGGSSSPGPGTGRGAATGLGSGYDILSDTQGVNFQPYMARLMRQIYEQWIPLIPEEARPPLNKSGVTQIRFTINPDGTVAAMAMDGSTHDNALNRAAWGSINGSIFPKLPPQFRGPGLELRIHFLVNRNTE